MLTTEQKITMAVFAVVITGLGSFLGFTGGLLAATSSSVCPQILTTFDDDSGHHENVPLPEADCAHRAQQIGAFVGAGMTVLMMLAAVTQRACCSRVGQAQPSMGDGVASTTAYAQLAGSAHVVNPDVISNL